MKALLNERQRTVLKAVIQNYISTAEPVGSRSISRRYLSYLSPATIRNTMADLEEMGFLSQPHTSAGRVPTDKGYRFYVDTLMERRRLTKAEEWRIEARIRPRRGEFDELMREISRTLSAISSYTAVVLAPKPAQNTFKRIEFIHLSQNRSLVVLVAESGLVHHKAIAIDEILTQEELDRISRYLNDMLQGLTLREVRERLLHEMAQEKAQFDQLVRRALELGVKGVEGEGEAEVYIGGAVNMAKQPEFADVEKVREIFAAFEEKAKLVKILDQCLMTEGFKIIIGNENQIREMRDLSIVASPYHSGGSALGAIGVVGPTRMEYARMVALVEFTAKLVSLLLTEPGS